MGNTAGAAAEPRCAHDFAGSGPEGLSIRAAADKTARASRRPRLRLLRAGAGRVRLAAPRAGSAPVHLVKSTPLELDMCTSRRMSDARCPSRPPGCSAESRYTCSATSSTQLCTGRSQSTAEPVRLAGSAPTDASPYSALPQSASSPASVEL